MDKFDFEQRQQINQLVDFVIEDPEKAAEKIVSLEAGNARLKSLLTQLYNKGYKAGHHDTVEAQYVDILDEDMNIYHEDIVDEIIEETD